MIIDGKKIAADLTESLKERLGGRGVRLDVILVGDYPPSQVYVQKKQDLCAHIGITSSLHRLSQDVSTQDVIHLIDQLNRDPSVHGILLQLPLPLHLDRFNILESIAPSKDVDGLTSTNLGQLLLGKPHIIPCTPLGCLRLIQSVEVDLAGKHAVIIGRSELVGKPMGHLLLNQNATVTFAHSKTKDLRSITKQADILVVAAGIPNLIQKDHVQKDCIVIDVGITRTIDGRIVGDVDFEDVAPYVKAITPVPGGVGPMTVAMLMENTLKCARL